MAADKEHTVDLTKASPRPWRRDDAYGWLVDATGEQVLISAKPFSIGFQAEYVDPRNRSNSELCLAAVNAYNPARDAAYEAMREALKAAIKCGLVPKSSAADGGANKYVEQVIVADTIRAALQLAEKADG